MTQSNSKPPSALKSRHEATVSELENYKLLVDSVQDYAIFLMDTKGYIRSWNKGAERNKGYTADEIIGKHFSTFYRQIDLDAKKPERELDIALKFGRAEDEDWRVRKDGSLFWASVVITALYNRDGEHVGFAKVTRDLTDRKKHEESLRQANKILKQQQLELQKLNKSKDEFISLASHQLRTPASAIKQILGMYTDGLIIDIDDKHLKNIKRAYENNERQINIVNGLLKVALVDSGEQQLLLTDCDIIQMLKDCVNEFTDFAHKKNQRLIFSEKSTTKIITADEHNLRMALENLINNAIKYTYDNGTIRITTTENDNTFTISISDNGVGIAVSDIDSLFKKFSRIPNDLSDQEGGTGLGLYWSNKIITLHGGKITVSSQINEGTTFHVTLPKGLKSAKNPNS